MEVKDYETKLDDRSVAYEDADNIYNLSSRKLSFITAATFLDNRIDLNDLSRRNKRIDIDNTSKVIDPLSDR